MAALAVASAQSSFIDCSQQLSPLLSDAAALERVKQLHKEGSSRFSSECLEILLTKGFKESSDYLIEQYYPKTRIDTEIIVNNVERDILRKQNYLLYQLQENLQKSKGKKWPPVVEPIVYYAQSRDAVYLKIKLAQDLESAGCPQSFSKQIDVGSNFVQISVVCFESEDKVQRFEKKIVFANEVILQDMLKKEEGDAIIELKVPKVGAPIYWEDILKNPNSSNVLVWKSRQDYYFEEVQDLKEKQQKEQAKVKKTKEAEQKKQADQKVDQINEGEEVEVVNL